MADLPTIEADLSELESNLAAQGLTIEDLRTDHLSKINAAHATAWDALDDAGEASTRGYEAEIAAKTYADQKIQKLRDDLGVQVSGLQSYVDGGFTDWITSFIESTAASEISAYSDLLDQLQATLDGTNSNLGSVEGALNQLVNDDLPVLQQNVMTIDQALTEAAAEAREAIAKSEQAFADHDATVAQVNGRIEDLKSKVISPGFDTSVPLSDRIEQNGTAITTETQERQDEDGALASRITTVSAKVDDAAAAVQTEEEARIDGDSALASRVQNVEAEVGDNRAQIQEVAAAEVDEDAVLSVVNQTVSAEYNDLKAMSEATQFAEAGINGLSSGFMFEAGNGSWELINIGSGRKARTSTKIDTDYIKLDGEVTITGSFQSLGMAIFGGDLRSYNYNSGQSGWRINNNGNAWFNGVVLSRQLQVASGTKQINISVSESSDRRMVKEFFVSTFVSVNPWTELNRTYVATAGIGGGATASDDADTDAADWGWSVEVVGATRWSKQPPGMIYLRIKFYAKTINGISGTLRWRLYRVT